MDLGKSITWMLLVMFSALLSYGQAPSPTQVGEKKGPAKVNTRPTPIATAPGEPFDKADIKRMASTCVTLQTEAGDIDIELYPESAPESVRNFLSLASIGAFDTTTFSRIVPGFVIQGGNIATREAGVSTDLAKRSRRTIPDEPSKILHERGIVSMARSDEPNAASTHFFILVDSAPTLDGKFAAFGKVTRGMDVVDAINKALVEGDKPVKPVRIRRAIVASCPEAISP